MVRLVDDDEAERVLLVRMETPRFCEGLHAGNDDGRIFRGALLRLLDGTEKAAARLNLLGCLPEEFLAVCEDEDTAFLLDFLPCNLRKDDCLATAGRHDEEKAALALLPFFLDGIDGLFLIRPEFHIDSSFPAKTVPVWPNIIILFCS